MQSQKIALFMFFMGTVGGLARTLETLEKLDYPPSTKINFRWDGHTPANTIESFQVNSKRFEGSLSGLDSSSYCLQYSCTLSGGSNGSTLVDCTAEGSTTVSGCEIINCPGRDFHHNGSGKKYCQ